MSEVAGENTQFIDLQAQQQQIRAAVEEYSILINDRDKVAANLKSKGVPTTIYYPMPLHLQTAFSSLGYKNGDFPVSENIAATILSLPMHPYLQPEDQDYIIDSLTESISKALRP